MTGKNIIDFINQHHLEDAYLSYMNDYELVLTVELNGSIKKSLDYRISDDDKTCEYYCDFERKDGEDEAVFCDVTFDQAMKIREYWDRKNGIRTPDSLAREMLMKLAYDDQGGSK